MTRIYVLASYDYDDRLETNQEAVEALRAALGTLLAEHRPSVTMTIRPEDHEVFSRIEQEINQLHAEPAEEKVS